MGLGLPASWEYLLRVLLGWNIAVWSYLVLMFCLMTRATSVEVAQLAEQEDEADWAIIVILSIAATASLVAIILELGA